MELEQKKAYLLLGSNMGERVQLIERAVLDIAARVGTIHARSSLYETAAWGNENQAPFINLAIIVESAMPAETILDTILDIELELGRVRLEHWGERLIDIDLIFYDNEIIDIPGKLVVPHPEMQHRKFVLEPLAEIANDYFHPVFKKTIADILLSLPDKLPVSKINL